MTVLVTGGAGFIGSNLVDRLVEQGKKVVVLDNYSTGNVENLIHLRGVHIMMGDITDKDRMKILDENYRFTHVFHLAALSRVEPSLSRPDLAYNTNVTGTLYMLELARKHNAKFVYAGSSTISTRYETPYGFTKYLGEELCNYYKSFHGVDSSIARFYNVYGPRQPESGEYATVIGIFEKLAREGKTLTITGDGTQRRDFIHVSDIVDGLIAISEKGSGDESYELGCGKNYSINEVAAMVSDNIKYIPAREGEAHATLCFKEYRENLGWEPKINLEDYLNGI